MPAEQRIQIKRRANEPSSASAWQGLLDGELGYIKNTNKLYIGNGKGVAPTLISTLSWDELTGKPTSILSQIYLNSTDPTKIVYKKVGNNTEYTLGNFAPLTNGLIDLKYLPQGALERLVVVANATARLKLTTANVQLGDTVKETDTGLMYVVVDESKLNSEDGYQVYVAGRAAAVDWTGVENKVNATASSAGLMSAADKKKLDNTNVAYGTCTTAANVAAKVITVSGNTGWKLAAGSMISIFFSYTNTAQNPTFNVNGTGAKNVYYNQSQITTSSLSYAGYTNRICNYIYDGTQFRFHSWGYDTNTNTQVRVYRNSTSSYNKDYPLIASRTLAADLGTVGTQDSNEAVYGLISDTAANIPTINPYSGAVKVKTLSATGNISTSDGNVSGKLLQTTAATNLNAVSDKVAVIKTGGQINYRTPAQIISDAGVAATVDELNYVDGVTSNIQTQLNSKAVATDTIYFNETGSIPASESYTNLIPTSTDLNGNVYNNIGYMPGVRWSGSGKQEVSATGYYITGFIPCETGNTLNVKNIDLNVEYPYLVLFDSSKNVISYTSMKNVLPDGQGVRSFLITESNVAFVRLVGKTIDESSVATVNEYITSAYSTGWLKKFNGAPIAPKTYISQVLDANNNPYEQHTHAYLPLKGGTLTGDLTLQQNNQDRFITFEYTGNTGFDWRIGSLGTGSADENYFVIQSDKDTANNGAFVNALRIGLTSLNALFGGNVTATKFIGPLQGNASTATKLANKRKINGTDFDGSADITTSKWGTARTISINSAAGTTGTSVDGSANTTLVVPATMTGFTSITSGTLNANTISVNSNNAADDRGLIVTRSGSTAESVRIGVNDSQAQFIYTNDEISSSFLFTMANTDTESNNTTNANTANVTFTGASGKSTVTADIFKGALTGNADTATKLKTARTIAISGGATGTATSFDGSGNITIPVTALDPTKLSSAVAINKGGTGATTAAQALINLGLTATAAELNYVDGVTSNIQTQLNNKYDKTGGPINGNVSVSGTSTLTGAVTAQSTLIVNGASTLKGAVTMNSTLQVDGKSTLKGDVDAKKTIKIGDGVTLQYNSTNKSLEFVFS